MAHLDFREKAGYSRQEIKVFKNQEKDDQELLCEAPKTLINEITLLSLLTAEPAPEIGPLLTCTNLFFLQAILYIGTEETEEFIGPESLSSTSSIIASSVGPSGKNTEYLFKLVDSLKEHDVCDNYTLGLGEAVRVLTDV